MNAYNSSDTDSADAGSDDQLAADVIRAKLARLYDGEPDARIELSEAEVAKHRTSHQEFMHQLSNSGKDLATIQTEWHEYYQALPDHEKHVVWHEFYSSQSAVTGQPPAGPAAVTEPDPIKVAEHKTQAASSPVAKQAAITRPKKIRDARSKADIQSAIRDSVTAGGKLQTKHHLQSLLFGLGMGSLVLLVFLFSFFNEVVIAPFIQPSRAEASTPLIISSNTVPTSSQPEVIIPKINVEIPVDYTQTTTNEDQIENGLENGIVHYPTTVMPGQNGNAAFFGHSSNNIFNKGKYKFAFVLLHTLVNGDTFYLTNNGKVYAYKVIDRKIVEPSEVGVLGPVPNETATATLITCDPPGTSLHRLVVVGKQISPDPATNTQAVATPIKTDTDTKLPGNGPTLLGRVAKSVVGKLVIAGIVLALAVFIIRRLQPWRLRAA